MRFARFWFHRFGAPLIAVAFVVPSAAPCRAADDTANRAAADMRVGASAVNLKCDASMVLAGMIEARYTDEQEGELRAVAVVVEKPHGYKVGIVACDVLWVPRWLVDEALAEIEKQTGIPPQNILVNASHTHHAPSTAPAHDFGVSPKFCEELKRGIVRAVVEANQRLDGGDAAFFFALGEEKTLGANSRLKLPGGNITWINPAREAGANPVPTGPFDPQLPVLEFRDARGKTRALLFNHSTHTIGTRSGKNVRSAGFYGLAAQELEAELGGTVAFLEGASGSTHNIAALPVAEAIVRLKKAVGEARSRALRQSVDRVAAIRRTMKFRVRTFNDKEEDAKIARYTTQYVPAASDRIRQVFAAMRNKLASKQGEERETYVQAIRIGDVALVGVPAEYFTALGLDIKRRSPFKHTYVAELANDWIGYLPDRDGHRLGGYQTWMGLHSYAEIGTGERVAELAVDILNELAKDANRERLAVPPGEKTSRARPGTDKPPASQRLDGGRRNPDDERRSFRLADAELTIDLVAAEPDVVSPVAMAWDADGRLYVAEMGGYPVTERKGRIRQLRDEDGDGRYEHSTVFADGLSFPATVMPYRGGILTIDAPDLLFLKDGDGDGRADVRRVEWTGFVPGSQQLRANALHGALDNWIYGANGRSGGTIRRPGAPAQSAVSIGGSDFRINPRAGTFEPIAGQSQFGQCHDDWGRRFLSWNVIPIRQAVVPEPHASRRASSLARAVIDIASADDDGRIFPVSPAPRQFNAESADYYNALCGLTIFRGDALGDAYRGNAFVGESLTNLVTRRMLKPRGVTFVAERCEKGREFLAAADPWFHPVFLTTGPDGALYVADFYREYVEHPLYVASAEIRGRIPWGRGGENGRIWRIRRKDQPARGAPRGLAQADARALVDLLSHPVGWWRDTAQRLLVERQDKQAVEALQESIRRGGSAVGTVHALWTLEGLGALDDGFLRTALGSSEPRVREQAIAIAEAKPARMGTLLPQLMDLLDDPDVGVAFRLALALDALPPDEVRQHALIQLARAWRADPWVLTAVLDSAHGQTGGLVRLLAEVDPDFLAADNATLSQFLLDAGERIGDEANPAETAAVVEWCADFDGGAEKSASGRILVLAGIARRGARLRASQPGPALVQHLPERLRGRLVRVTAAVASDRSRPAIVRAAATRLLSVAPPSTASGHLRELLNDPAAAEVRASAAEALADLNDADSCLAVYGDWERLPGDVRRAMLSAAGRSDGATSALVDAVSRDVVRLVELPIEVVDSLKRSGSGVMRKRAESVLAVRVSSDRTNVVERYMRALAQPGDSIRGAAVFRENCLACHTIQRFGQQVGPELSGVSSRPLELLLHDILDPSAQISADFANYILVTDEGKTFDGLLVARTVDSVRLRRAQGEEIVVPVKHIEQLRASNKSLMPEGFEAKIDFAKMADLLAFLRQPSRDLLRTDSSAPTQRLSAPR